MRTLVLVFVSVVVACGSPTKPSTTSQTTASNKTTASPAEPSSKERPDGQIDSETDVLWSRQTSAKALVLEDAIAFCSGQGDAWRLPTRAELSSLFVGPDWELLERVLKPEFEDSLSDPGRLWSDDDVSPKRVGQKWAVDLRNGQFQNLHKREAHARCVHGEELVAAPLEFPNDVSYDASQGGEDSKVTWTLYCQYDPFCKNLAPVLDDAVKERSLRVVWKQWVVSPRSKLSSLAVCAATRQGRWAPMHRFILVLDASDPSREQVEAVASKLGLDLERFKKDLEGACPAGLAANSQAARKLGLEGTPSLIVAPGQTMSPFEGFDKLKPEFAAALEAVPKR